MVPISLGDRLSVELTRDGGVSFACNQPNVPAGKENLVVQAAALWLKEFGQGHGVRVFLHKEIPIGAGLGGGSSDAAATLLALRTLTGNPPSVEELVPLAAQLGSDIPFFLFRAPALCLGRGEQVTPIPWEEPLFGVLFYPGFRVPTAWAYSAYDRDPAMGKPGPVFFFGQLRNDLEKPVFRKFLWLPAAKTWLENQPEVEGALMSGSGSSLFALLSDPEQKESLIGKWHEVFGEEGWVKTFQVLPSVPLWPPPSL